MPTKKTDTSRAARKLNSEPTDRRETKAEDASHSEPLRKLYSGLLRCRRIQEHLRDSFDQAASDGKYDLAIGREAVAIGAVADLIAGDTIAASARDLPALIAKGAPPKALLANHGLTGTMADWFTPPLPQDPFNAGTGLALAHKLDQKQQVTVAFSPQEKPRLEAWHDALKFAAIHKLPIVFVIEDGIAGDSSSDLAPHLEPLSFFTRDYGFPGILVDGSDAVAIARVAQEAVHRARNGSGATLIECRSQAGQDPLPKMEGYLRKRNAWDEHWKLALEQQISRELEEATGSAQTPSATS